MFCDAFFYYSTKLLKQRKILNNFEKKYPLNSIQNPVLLKSKIHDANCKVWMANKEIKIQN